MNLRVITSTHADALQSVPRTRQLAPHHSCCACSSETPPRTAFYSSATWLRSAAASTLIPSCALALLRRGRRSRHGCRQRSGAGRSSAFRHGSVGRSSSSGSASDDPMFESDSEGRRRLRYSPDGWNTWTWEPQDIASGRFECNYVVAGPRDGQAVVLVHGFGASSYHWRYQIPELAAQGFRVYALCLLGYGWSSRSVLMYSGEVWATQINAFVSQVVGCPAVLVGNSIGAFSSLIAASLDARLCRGLVLLNAAGRFEERQEGVEPNKQQLGDVVAQAAEQSQPGPLQWLLSQMQRTLATWAFVTTKMRIGPILEWVYVNNGQVDEDLITSIRMPAEHPDALDAFGEVIQAGRRTKCTVFEALDNIPVDVPILLLWGMQDPWMRPIRAAAIRSECAQRGLKCEYVELDAGHCPQDDAPEAVNENLTQWLQAQRFEKESVPAAIGS